MQIWRGRGKIKREKEIFLLATSISKWPQQLRLDQSEVRSQALHLGFSVGNGSNKWVIFDWIPRCINWLVDQKWNSQEFNNCIQCQYWRQQIYP